MLRLVLVGSLLVVGLTVPACAGEYNTKMNIGDAVPKFSGLQGTDGKAYSLDDFKKKDILVVAITCNHCPVAKDYEDRLIGFTKTYAGADAKVGVIAINVSISEEDTLEKMKERTSEKSFNFPYVIDPSQNIGRALGATATPQFYVFDKDRKLAYMGALDDNINEKKVKTHYLADAVQAMLKGAKPETAETKPVGCGIAYQKNRD
jgi:peroxiredoxin